MKRTKKTIEKRTYSMKGAIPTFISLVSRGANFTPFSQLKYNENEQFGQDVEISRVEFSKTIFTDKASVETYLNSNNFEDFSIQEDETVFYVSATDTDQFSTLSEVEYEDGVKYFIGKLNATKELETPAAEVIAAEEFAAVEKIEEVAEVVQNSEETLNEEIKPEGEDGTSKEVAIEFTAEEKIQEEVAPATFEQFLTTEKYSTNSGSFREMFDSWRAQSNMIPSYDMLSYGLSDANYNAVSSGNWEQFKNNLNDYYGAVFSMVSASKNLAYSEDKIVKTEEDEVKISEEKFAELMAKVAELEEKVQQSEEKNKVDIDETVIVVQNSQSIQNEEIITTTITENKAEESAKFSQKKRNDLFGLR